MNGKIDKETVDIIFTINAHLPVGLTVPEREETIERIYNDFYTSSYNMPHIPLRECLNHWCADKLDIYDYGIL